MTEMTQEEFQAMVSALQDYAAVHPINVVTRLNSGLGAPLDHRRDFQYRGQSVRVLLTQDVLDFPSRPMQATHLSVVSLKGCPLPEALKKEILAAFFPGQECDRPKSILDAGLEPGQLLIMPSAVPGVTQYSVLVPVEVFVPVEAGQP